MTSTDKGGDARDPWLAYCEDEDYTEDQKAADLLLLMKNLLLPLPGTTVEGTANTIANYYSETYLQPSECTKFSEDLEGEAVSDYIATIYWLIFDLAQLLPYKYSRQDILVELIRALCKIDLKSFLIWGESRRVFGDEPVSFGIMHDAWNGNFVSDDIEHQEEQGDPGAREKCDQWVNLSSFFARCIQASILHCLSNRWYYPSIDIPAGLEKEDVIGVKRTCRIMVAAQYLLLATRPIHEDLSKVITEGWGLEKWQLWAKRLKEIADKDGIDPEVISAVKEAREKMISYDPTLFFVSEGGSKPDP